MSHTPATLSSQHFSSVRTSTWGFGCCSRQLGPRAQLPGEPFVLASSLLNKDSPLPKSSFDKGLPEAAPKSRLSRGSPGCWDPIRHLLWLYLPPPKPGSPTHRLAWLQRTGQTRFKKQTLSITVVWLRCEDLPVIPPATWDRKGLPPSAWSHRTGPGSAVGVQLAQALPLSKTE